MEPAEQRLPGGPRKRPAQHGFLVTGRLADEHYFADHRAAADHWCVHLGALAAGAQTLHVAGQRAGGCIFILFCGHAPDKTVFPLLQSMIRLAAWTEKSPDGWKSWNHTSPIWNISMTSSIRW